MTRLLTFVFSIVSALWLGYLIGRADRLAAARRRLFLKTVARLNAVARRRRANYIAAHADEWREM